MQASSDRQQSLSVQPLTEELIHQWGGFLSWAEPGYTVAYRAGPGQDLKGDGPLGKSDRNTGL